MFYEQDNWQRVGYEEKHSWLENAFRWMVTLDNIGLKILQLDNFM